ncbi:sugar phosphate isomerase/epimerase family protein [Azohydromonas caseinilytica]|uniref:Sugar phosphate isomerase/epimerase n=1 Tax=Azohydromonas caseinilytica TaxID=2728836 RepID=A0A848FCW8_9BURK|nr:TIM barrel protein [Azohydromonas caseinilytica]NML15791.1 sugar phosphate isomerase/epimerase [Azohydromonas caseinilytica]
MTPIDDFGLDTASLAGPLEARLRALREAGFSRVVLQARDLMSHPGGFEAAVAAVKASGLQVAALQALRDFEGLQGPRHDYKVEVAKAMLETCRAVGSPLLVATSACAAAQPGGDPEALARDLRKLAMLAVPPGIRIAYQAVAAGRHVNDFNIAWELVSRADCPNLGLALDACHALGAGTSLELLEDIDPEKLFLVRLADALSDAPCADGAAVNVFPGEGVLAAPLAALTLRLDRMGYRGSYALSVCNDESQQLPPATVARRARRAAEWLSEEVLRRSAPLPNLMKLRGAAGG